VRVTFYASAQADALSVMRKLALRLYEDISSSFDCKVRASEAQNFLENAELKKRPHHTHGWRDE